MADTIELAADSSDLKVAIGLLQDYEQAFVSMVNKVQTEGNRLSRASKATAGQVGEAFDRMVTKLNNDSLARVASEEAKLLKTREQNWKQFFQQDFMRNQNTSSARDSIFVDMLKKEEEAAKHAVVTSRELAKEKELLTLKYAPLTAAAQKYELELEGLNLAQQRGIITSDSHGKQLAQLKTEYDALGKGVYLAGSRFNQFGEMAGVSGKSAQRFGMYAQQAGYQIGDFAVQVQSGTNVGVAFSQQAAQLAGLIPGLAGAITTFAAIGLGMLIQNLTRSKKETKELENSLRDLQALDQIFKTAGVSFGDSLGGAIDKVREKYGDLVADVTNNTVVEKLANIQTKLLESFPRASANNTDASSGWIGRRWNEMGLQTAEAWGIAQAEADKYNEVIDILRENFEGLTNQEFTSAQQAVSFLADQFEMLRESGILSTEQMKKYSEVLRDLGVSKAIEDEITKREELAAKELEKATELQDKMRGQLSILQLINEHGKDSLTVKQAELEAERQKDLALARSLETSQEVMSATEDAVNAAYDAESATLNWADAMAEVNAQIQSSVSLLNSIGGGMVQNAGLSAANAVLDAGGKAVDAEKARRRAEELARFRIESQTQDGFKEPWQIDAEIAEKRRQWDAQDIYETRLSAVQESEREARKKPKSGGRGKKPKKTDDEKYAEKFQDYLDQFEIHMEQQESLIGLYGEQREKQEKIIEIENRLGDARHLASQKQIEAWAEEEIALEKRLETEKQIYDTLNSGFEDFIMNVVGGTHSIEDAFKQMLSNMIKEMYNNLLAKPASNWLSDIAVGLFSANGNAFGVGGVKMFAKGGVVDGPTPFNYSGGLGVMGEAGPEAIMPLERNSQGQLGVQVSGGSGGGIVINQTFQYSANGDESVRNIIKSSMPEISNRTKAAIIQAKARGEKGL